MELFFFMLMIILLLIAGYAQRERGVFRTPGTIVLHDKKNNSWQ